MSKSIAKKYVPQNDSYMSLVLRCPLKTIKSGAEHAAASAMISELMGRKLDTGSGDYLDAQIIFVTRYEDTYEPVEDFGSPQEALRALMKANDLSQADIGTIVGSESAVSMFLNGTRSLSKRHIKALAERCKIDASLFL